MAKPARSRQFRLVNLQDQPAVMKQIAAAEQNINRLVEGDVALIAYVRDQDE